MRKVVDLTFHFPGIFPGNCVDSKFNFLQGVTKRDLIMGLRTPIKVKKLSSKEKQDERALLGNLYEDKVFLRCAQKLVMKMSDNPRSSMFPELCTRGYETKKIAK